MRQRLLKTAVTFDEQIHGQHRRENFTGAWCLTCLKPVDREELVEFNKGAKNYARVLCGCHGAEELCTFEFGSELWDETDLKRAMDKRVWFDPHGTNGVIASGGVL